MTKKIGLILTIILTIVSVVNATVNVGQLDDAKCLKENEKQMGGFFGFTLTPYSYVGDIYDSTYSFEFSIIPISGLTNLTGHYVNFNPMLLVPRFSMGYILRKGLKNNNEFSFGTMISSPNFVNFGFMGPDIGIYIGIKKNFFNSKNFNFSYKFNFGAEYTALPGFELIIKNSFMFGSNRDTKNFTLILSLQNSLGTIMPFIFMTGPIISLTDYGYATISPEVEFSWSRHKTSGFTSNVSLFCNYNITVDLVNIIERFYNPYIYDDEYYCCGYYMPNTSGVLKVGMKFAWQGRFLTAE